MFGRRQKRTIEVTKLSSLIADNLHIVGDVLFSGGLRVDGRIEGNVLGKPGEKSLIVLSEKGCIIGRVHAHDAVVNGTVSGDLEVEHFLELQAGARVSGSIAYRQLQMECGATVEGKLVRSDEAESAVEAREAAGQGGVQTAGGGKTTRSQCAPGADAAERGTTAGGEAPPAVLRQGARAAGADQGVARPQPAAEAPASARQASAAAPKPTATTN
jgi:cytoskeletal protein CcmA (bactofilin family)